MNKKWKEKMYLNFIGAISERDEYQIQEINKDIAIAGILLWYLNLLAMLVMLVVDTINQTASVGTIIIFVNNMIFAYFLMWKLQKKGLAETECATEEEYLAQKKILKKSGFKAGVFWGLQMFIFMTYIFPFLSNEKVSVSLFDVILWGTAGAFFGFAMYGIALSNLKKLY